jgi:hypothetical protein
VAQKRSSGETTKKQDSALVAFLSGGEPLFFR